MPNLGDRLNLSRRSLLVSGAVPLAGRRGAWPDFDLWSAEHERVGALLEITPEAEEDVRNLLLDRLVELEGLILNTASCSASAVRSKAKILLWLMQMERHDGVAAMRDVRDFLFRWSR